MRLLSFDSIWELVWSTHKIENYTRIIGKYVPTGHARPDLEKQIVLPLIVMHSSEITEITDSKIW